MSTNVNRRILQDYRNLKKDCDKGIYAEPLPQDITLWNAVIMGPKGSIWERGVFKLTMEFPKNYPTSNPTVKFITPMYHPNSKNNNK